MSAILKLTHGYGSFFLGCAKFAVTPYTNTFMAIAKEGNGRGSDFENVVAAAIVCGILTFVVPVLPVLATFTCALASIAMLLAVVSMFVTYPIAVLSDAFDASWENDHQFSI